MNGSGAICASVRPSTSKLPTGLWKSSDLVVPISNLTEWLGVLDEIHIKKHHALNTRRSGVLHLGQKARKPSLQGQFFCTLATLVGKIHWLRYLPFGKSMFGTLGFRPILAMIRIKPSLAWVLYRAGYGFKDANQDVGRPHWGVFTVSVKGRGYIDQGAPSGLWLFPCYYGHQQCW